MTPHLTASTPRRSPRGIGADAQIQAASQALHKHPVFSHVRTMEQLRVFMSWHVFAVWDFMSLAKRLQAEFTCLSLPWLPPRDAAAARLINEIVMAEESDEDGLGAHSSHFNLYLRAMQQLGADTQPIEALLRNLARGVPAARALFAARIDPAVVRFVSATLHTAQASPLAEVLGSFVYGRENVIPGMFSSLLGQWGIRDEQAPSLVYYLRRHIALDGHDHGPATERLVQAHVGHSAARRASVTAGALHAMHERLALWDALARRLARA
jgi:Protein of unknown function (DUF3050)